MKEFRDDFKADLKRYEQENQMPYITSIERMGIAEGLEQGLEQGLERQRSLILRQLTRRVGIVPDRLTNLMTQLPIDQLEALAEALLDFTNLNDLVQWLESDP